MLCKILEWKVLKDLIHSNLIRIELIASLVNLNINNNHPNRDYLEQNDNEEQALISSGSLKTTVESIDYLIFLFFVT